MEKKEVTAYNKEKVQEIIIDNMSQKSIHIILKTSAFVFVLLLFCYFRLKPIHFQTVGYTYDQGRDFLKAAEIVLYKNITFIGPTTGIMGLYHGAWWFYVLTIPFMLFHGAPIGFYYFNFIIQLISFAGLGYILYKHVGKLSSIIALSILAVSPYFIFTSTFVGNNIMVLPSLLLLILTTFLLFNTKKEKQSLLTVFLIGLSLMFVAEFEVAFGLFIVPIYILSLILFKPLRNIVTNIRSVAVFLLGIFIPLLPRLLFEVKHGFQQTKVLLSFFVKPKLHNPKAYMDVFQDRLGIFIGYYKSIFPADWLAYAFLILVGGFLIYRFRTKSWRYGKQILFFTWLVGMLFFLSTFYKDNFWGNYYEGIQYVMLFLGILIITPGTRQTTPLVGYIKIAFIAIVLVISSLSFAKELQKKPEVVELALMQRMVSYITDREKGPDYCVRVYTPPVVPYTYDYLFLYHRLTHNTNMPGQEWLKNKCWFIIENDSYAERRDTWMKANIPADYKKIQSHQFKTAIVEQWQK